MKTPRWAFNQADKDHTIDIPASLLKDGDILVSSNRYGRRLYGRVTINCRAPNLVFLESPALEDEDVAFQDNERVVVCRAAPQAEGREA